MQVRYVSPSCVKGGLIFLCQHPNRRVSQRIGVDFSVDESMRSEFRFDGVPLTFIDTSSSFSCCFPATFPKLAQPFATPFAALPDAHAFVHNASGLFYMPMPPDIDPGLSSSCSSEMSASVVSIKPAIDAAFCSAQRVTFAGSMMPAATRSSNLSVAAL